MDARDLRKLIREEVRRALNERIEVVTWEFEASHGKAPKGSGQWAFRLEDHPRGKDGEVIWPTQGKGAMTYAQALKLAKKQAKEEGMNYVVVMP
jgi:hypothetical protein